MLEDVGSTPAFLLDSPDGFMLINTGPTQRRQKKLPGNWPHILSTLPVLAMVSSFWRMPETKSERCSGNSAKKEYV